MANEAQIRSSLIIAAGGTNTGNLQYQSQPTSFNADVSSNVGPTPGGITVPTAGVDVSLSEITTPGLCRIMNLDATNFIEVGVWDGTTFFPLLELLAGETYVMRLARNLTQEYGTGTGTVGAAINTLRLKADTAACEALVEIFPK